MANGLTSWEPLTHGRGSDCVLSLRFRRWLWGIVVGALLVRMAVVIYAERRPAVFDFPDSHRYARVARHIAEGRGPIDSEAVRSGTDPLYPLVLSVGVLFGDDDDAWIMQFGRKVNALFGVTSVALLALFAVRLVGERAALIAAGILALDPILLFFNALVLTETLYITLVLGGFCCIVRMGGLRGWLWASGGGLLIGLATVTRSSSLFLPAVLVPFVWHFSRADPPARGVTDDGSSAHRGRRVVTACFLVATCLALVPTVARNYRLFGHFVPVRTGSGASLMEALGPWADGGPGMDRILYPRFPVEADAYVRDRICREAAFDWVREHPMETLRLGWTKLRRTWSVTLHAPGYTSRRYAAIAWASVGPELLMAVCGIWMLRRQPWTGALLLIVAVYFTLVHMVFVGSVRYRVPAMPLLFVAAGVATDRFVRWTARRRAS